MPDTRYAIYYTLPPGPLADLAAAWLGWDIARGCGVEQPALPGLPRPLPQITATPRKYGFHATLKPPFRLAEGCDPAGLEQALRGLCAQLAPVPVAGLRVAAMGGFVALLPEGPVAGLGHLAARLVCDLDGFRAPAGAAELARRRAAGLSPAQEAHLLRWGYPHVLDQFHFHMTLSGALDAGETAPVAAAARAWLAGACGPFALGDVTLAAEDAAGRFHAVTRVPLGG